MERISLKNPDFVGVIASLLCLIHCIVTPFLFLSSVLIVIPPHGHNDEFPLIWSALEICFLALSYWSVRQTSRKTNLSWISYALHIAWSLLAVSVLFELADIHVLGEFLKYASTSFLIVLHFYHYFRKQISNNSI